MKKISTAYFLIIAIAALLWLPWLLAKGMFMDGMYNAILAQNLAHGVASFWSPQTNDYSNPAYWNNPPLSMFTLGCCYKIFGDSYIVEKVYSLACAVMQLFLIAFAWRIFWKEEAEIKKYAWLPCLLWLISPLTGWCYSNNLMENTMSIFTTLALISFLLFSQLKRHKLLFAMAGAAFILSACLTKGPTGMFPLAVPIFFISIKEKSNWKAALNYSIIQFSFFVLLFVVVFSIPDAKNFLHQYLSHQLLPAINHEAKAETQPNIIFQELLIMVLPFLILLAASLFVQKKEGNKNSQNFKAIPFILSGLAASLPIALSMKQRKFYLLPSLPFFVLGFSILILPLAKFIEKKLDDLLSVRILLAIKWICVLLIIFSVSLSVYNRNTFCRDKEMLSYIEGMLPLIKNEEAVCADWQLYGEWSLRAYCTRYYNKKLYMPDKISETKFYMTKHGLRGDKLANDATKVYSSNTFDLYRLK